MFALFLRIAQQELPIGQAPVRIRPLKMEVMDASRGCTLMF